MHDKIKYIKILTVTVIFIFVSAGLIRPESLPAGKKSYLVYTCASGRAKTPDAAIMQRTLTAVSRYSPAGNFMIGELRSLHAQICGEEYTAFLNYIPRPLVSDLMFYNAVAVAVHEEAHNFWRYYYALKSGNQMKSRPGEILLEEQKKTASLYLPEKGVLHVPVIQTFPAFDAAKTVTDPLIRDDGRFKVYFADEKGKGRSNDLFLLLNEFHSYYHSDTALLQRRKDPSNTDVPIHEYLDLGFIQFKFYILHFFIFAEENRPEIYKRLMENSDLKTAFVRIHDEYEKTFHELNPAQQGKRSSRVMWDKRRALEKLLDSPAYISMMKKLRG